MREGAFIDAPSLAPYVLPGPGGGGRRLVGRVGRGIRRLRDHDDALALESELGDGFLGERLGGDDHVGRALYGEMAQAQVDATTAQTLTEAGARAELMDRDDHRAWAVQHRALHRGCVKHVICLAGTMRLDDLCAACADRVAQRFE